MKNVGFYICTQCFFYFNFCEHPLPIWAFPPARFIIWGVRQSGVRLFFFFYKHWFHFSCRFRDRLAININPTKFVTFRGRQNVS